MALPATGVYDYHRKSFLSSLHGFKVILPGLLAMLYIAIFSNNLPGVPNPFTLENFFSWLDGVIGPLNHQPFFQILNSNFVWNPMLMGFVIGNLFGVPDCWKRGLSLIHVLMPLGIIMLGHAFKLGFWPVMIFAFFMFLTATITLWLGKLFKMDDRHASIISGSLSTGDPHAGVILMPLVKAKGGQVIHASIGVIGFGIIAMLLLPRLTGFMDLPPSFAGLGSVIGVGNGHQALYAAYENGYEAGRYAQWFDVGRHVLMPAGFLYVFVVMLLRRMRSPIHSNVTHAKKVDIFPYWLGMFVFAWILACLHVFPEPAHEAIFNMVKWDFSLAAAALGLSISFKDIFSAGAKGFTLILTAGILRIALLLAALAVCVKTGLLH
jgi:uncharacterized membrane protein YadS